MPCTLYILTSYKLKQRVFPFTEWHKSNNKVIVAQYIVYVKLETQYIAFLQIYVSIFYS